MVNIKMIPVSILHHELGIEKAQAKSILKIKMNVNDVEEPILRIEVVGKKKYVICDERLELIKIIVKKTRKYTKKNHLVEFDDKCFVEAENDDFVESDNIKEPEMKTDCLEAERELPKDV